MGWLAFLAAIVAIPAVSSTRLARRAAAAPALTIAVGAMIALVFGVLRLPQPPADWIAIALVVFFLLPPVARAGRAPILRTAGIVVALGAVAFATFGVVNAGHTGAKASWSEVVATTTPGEGD